MFCIEVAPGLEIRQFEERDAADVFAVVSRNRVYLREWLPWLNHTHSAADISDFIRRAQSQFEARLGPQCAIWSEGALIGSVGCHPIDWANRACSVGYWIDAACQGKGLMTRCAAALLRYLFGELNLHRIEIRCGTGNSRSCAIPERLGFTREGVLREAELVNDRWVDLVVWSMLEQDWRTKAAGPLPGGGST